MNPQVQLVVTIGAVVVALLSLVGVVYTARSGRRANTEDRDAVWNAGYRAAAEPHLYWDVRIVAILNEAQSEINILRVRNGLEPKVFEPIPQPPPLFPKLDAK